MTNPPQNFPKYWQYQDNNWNCIKPPTDLGEALEHLAEAVELRRLTFVFRAVVLYTDPKNDETIEVAALPHSSVNEGTYPELLFQNRTELESFAKEKHARPVDLSSDLSLEFPCDWRLPRQHVAEFRETGCMVQRAGAEVRRLGNSEHRKLIEGLVEKTQKLASEEGKRVVDAHNLNSATFKNTGDRYFTRFIEGLLHFPREIACVANLVAAADDRSSDDLASSPDEAPAPKKQKSRNRGRPRDTDSKADRRLAEAWATKTYKTYQDLANEKYISEHKVKCAIDRHRKRTKGKKPPE